MPTHLEAIRENLGRRMVKLSGRREKLLEEKPYELLYEKEARLASYHIIACTSKTKTFEGKDDRHELSNRILFR